MFLRIALSWDSSITIILSITTFRLRRSLGSLLQCQKKKKDLPLKGLKDRRQPFFPVGEGKEAMR